MTDVFISYSRKDSPFVQRLNTALVDDQRLVWVDWQAIPAGEDWWAEIRLGIENAETFVVVISENWLKSRICHQELDYARLHNKRILPVIRQSITPELEAAVIDDWVNKPYESIAQDNWEYIRHLNWIMIDSDAIFEDGFYRLLHAIDEDQPHLKAHTRYLRRALEWKRSEENPSFLLVGDDLTFAEKWLKAADGQEKTPHPTDLQRRYIDDSRRSSDELLAREQARERRIQQFRVASMILGVIGLAAIIATAIAIPASIEANNSNATSVAQIGTAEKVLVTATAVVEQVGTSEASLSTAVQAQSTAIQAQEDAELAANQAQTQVAVAEQELTRIPPTLTAVASTVAKTQRELNISTNFSIVDERLQDGLVNAALREANQTVEDYPNEYSAYTGRASLYQEIGELEKAIADYDQAIELEPDRASTYNSRALILDDIGEIDAAFADYATAISLSPDNAAYYANRASLHSFLGDIESAIEDLSKAIEVEPDYVSAYVTRAHLLSNTDLEAALADLNQAIEINPLEPNAYNSRANIYNALGDPDAALEDLNMAIELEPEYATYYGNRAANYSSRGDLEAALQDLNKAIRLDPLYPTYYNNRYFVNSDLGNTDAALDDISMAIELEPAYPNTYLSRALLYNDLAEYDLALADINQYIELSDDLVGGYDIRGTIYSAKGDIESAIADYNTIIDELTEPGIMIASTIVNRGWAYYLQGNYELALEDFSRVIRAVPDDLFALFNRGITLIQMGYIDLAYQDYAEAVRIYEEANPYPEIQVIDIAITDLNLAIEATPENGNLYVFRGYLYYVQGNVELAQADWETAEENNGEFVPEILTLVSTSQ